MLWGPIWSRDAMQTVVKTKPRRPPQPVRTNETIRNMLLHVSTEDFSGPVQLRNIRMEQVCVIADKSGHLDRNRGLSEFLGFEPMRYKDVWL